MFPPEFYRWQLALFLLVVDIPCGAVLGVATTLALRRLWRLPETIFVVNIPIGIIGFILGHLAAFAVGPTRPHTHGFPGGIETYSREPILLHFWFATAIAASVVLLLVSTYLGYRAVVAKTEGRYFLGSAASVLVAVAGIMWFLL